MTDTKKPLVRTFNDDEIKKLISKAPKELQEYIRATKDALDGQYRIALLAVKKLRDRTPEPVVMELVELVDKYCEGPALVAMPFVKFRDKYRDILSRLPERYKR